jgi:hypothetical protein
MAARQALRLCEAELLRRSWNTAAMPPSDAGNRRGQTRVSVIATRAALRAAGVPPHTAATLRSRLRLIPEPEDTP